MKKTIINFLLISIILLMSHTEVFAHDVNDTKSNEVSLAPKDILTQINKIEANIADLEASTKILEEELNQKTDEVSRLKSELEERSNKLYTNCLYEDNAKTTLTEITSKLNNAKLNNYYMSSTLTIYVSLTEQFTNIASIETEIQVKSQQLTQAKSDLEYQKNELQKYNTYLGVAIVDYAEQFVGNPYVWGGNSLTNGIDCSHFVYQVLKNCGVYYDSYVTSAGWRSKGVAVSSLKDAKAGDIICYSGHVAIYDGNGGIVEAKGSKWGITHDRQADCSKILAIRRFI